MDRAKPSFALSIIEMFHHLDTELPTHVVYSVDLFQLNGIIKHYYGYEYNTEIFTHKTFDTIIKIPKIERYSLEKYIENKFPNHMLQSYRKFPNLLLKYMDNQHLNSLRTINKLVQNITINYSEGYFRESSIQYEYFLGKGHRWYYVEFMIALNVFKLNHPIEVRGFTTREHLRIFKEFLLEKERKTNASGLWNLIRESSNNNKGNDLEIKNNIDLDDSSILDGLVNIFWPPNGDLLSVFDMFNS